MSGVPAKQTFMSPPEKTVTDKNNHMVFLSVKLFFGLSVGITSGW